ncbi:hypothetical protein V5799_006182 [Amblyomma americanum]|uniref:CCHC-type domain-containing protein n=1 Tax=Amblyomma americanum TaxID=6943 RepID=A0AAQ4DX46_AMBAM
MAELEKIIALGKQLGFEGVALQEFLRDERAKQRERMKEEQRLLEEEERDKARSARRMLELNAELQILHARGEGGESAGSDSASVQSEPTSRFTVVSPHKLVAPFNDKTDDLDAYLTRFEGVAEAQKWPRDQWATAHSICLAGEALTVFRRVPGADAVDYDKVKRALLLRFRLTEEGFRQKFLTEAPHEHETPSQFFSRLENFWERWVQLSSCEQTYEGIKSLLLREQFLENCTPSMATFLKEKTAGDQNELLQRADNYVSARVSTYFGRRELKREDRPVDMSSDAGRKGHQGKPLPAAVSSTPRCYICARPGHVAAHCKESRRNPEQGNRARPGAKGVSACIQNCYLELKDGQFLPVVNLGRAQESGVLPVVEGLIAGQRIKVLRDTGCNIVIVNLDLVTKSQLTGRHRAVYLVDRSVKRLPEARIQVYTPYYRGEVLAG